MKAAPGDEGDDAVGAAEMVPSTVGPSIGQRTSSSAATCETTAITMARRRSSTRPATAPSRSPVSMTASPSEAETGPRGMTYAETAPVRAPADTTAAVATPRRRRSAASRGGSPPLLPRWPTSRFGWTASSSEYRGGAEDSGLVCSSTGVDLAIRATLGDPGPRVIGESPRPALRGTTGCGRPPAHAEGTVAVPFAFHLAVASACLRQPAVAPFRRRRRHRISNLTSAAVRGRQMAWASI